MHFVRESNDKSDGELRVKACIGRVGRVLIAEWRNRADTSIFAWMHGSLASEAVNG